MSINFAGIKLKTPYIAASGCFGYGWEFMEKFGPSSWGAVSGKTITLNPRQGNPPPRIFEVECAVVNRIGLHNCGLDIFLNQELPKIKKLNYPVFVSIFGENFDQWQEILGRLSKKHIKAVELNLSCPNIHGEKIIKNIKQCSELVYNLKKRFKLSLIAKINAVDEPVKLSRELNNSGIDGIICSNSIPGSVVFEGSIINGGLCGPAIKPVVLNAINKITDNVDVDVAGCGGIASYKDVQDYKSAGAKAFVLGSILLSKPYIIDELLKEGKNG
ncbi:MAG: HisA/HisF-related TIM barrel protein [Elusimicrobiota bacterium]